MTLTDQINNLSLRSAAMIAGICLLIMAVLAPFANFYILQKLIVMGDSAATIKNIIAFEGLYRIGIGDLLFVAILDIVVAWALYVLLEKVNKSLSLLAAWFRVIYAVFLGIASVNLYNALHLVKSADFMKGGIEAHQLQVQVLSSVYAFRNGWDMGLLIFGLHLAVLGYLVFKSGSISRIIGILVMAAGLGYLTDSVGKILISGYNMSVSLFTFGGEVLFMFWLLWRGIKGFGENTFQKTGL